MRRQVAPRAPRRVSGPAGGAATVALPAVAPRIAPPRTAPARSPRSRPRSRPAAARAPWRIRSAAYLRGLPDHALLDHIIRGRVWIPLFGVLLVGIVAMQVEVLKLNAGIGRSLERASALQSQNELLRAGVARLSDEQRIERIAAGMGMVMPAPDQMRFVRGGPTSVEHALDSIKAPSATTFLAQLPTIGAPAAAQGTSTNTSVGIASGTAAGTTPTGATASTAAGGTAGTPATTSGTSAASGATSPAQSTSAASTPATTSTGTPGSTVTGTPASAGSGTSATAPVTPAAPSTAAGTTSQSSPSSTGGATPVGG
ncbi:MAG: hypothetical protein ACXVRX_07995 [Solirubrobacteraceae bacterium]